MPFEYHLYLIGVAHGVEKSMSVNFDERCHMIPPATSCVGCRVTFFLVRANDVDVLVDWTVDSFLDRGVDWQGQRWICRPILDQQAVRLSGGATNGGPQIVQK